MELLPLVFKNLPSQGCSSQSLSESSSGGSSGQYLGTLSLSSGLQHEIVPTALGDCGCVSTNPAYKKSVSITIGPNHYSVEFLQMLLPMEFKHQLRKYCCNFPSSPMLIRNSLFYQSLQLSR